MGTPQPLELASVEDLYAAEYDFPNAAEPRLRYMVATTQRSGSNLLALTLWQTGGLGAPLEYLRAANIALLQQRLGTSCPLAYWRSIQQHRTSPNGVFGFKAFGSHIKECGRDMRALLDHCLPVDRTIFLTREDKDCQAISLARATQTDAWTASASPRAEPDFDRDFIAGCRGFIERQEIAWQRYFERSRSVPLFLTYEALATEPEQTARRIAQAMGVDSSGCERVQLPVLRRQADGQSQQWLQRLRTSAHSSGA